MGRAALTCACNANGSCKRAPRCGERGRCRQSAAAAEARGAGCGRRALEVFPRRLEERPLEVRHVDGLAKLAHHLGHREQRLAVHRLARPLPRHLHARASLSAPAPRAPDRDSEALTHCARQPRPYNVGYAKCVPPCVRPRLARQGETRKIRLAL